MGPRDFAYFNNFSLIFFFLFSPSCIAEHERKEVLKTQLKRRFDNHAKRSCGRNRDGG